MSWSFIEAGTQSHILYKLNRYAETAELTLDGHQQIKDFKKKLKEEFNRYWSPLLYTYDGFHVYGSGHSGINDTDAKFVTNGFNYSFSATKKPDGKAFLESVEREVVTDPEPTELPPF